MRNRIFAAMLLGSALPWTAICGTAQTGPPTPLPVFDVDTVKPNNSGGENMQINWTDDTYRATNVKVLQLLSNAYSIRTDLISGLPGWAQSAHWDIVAKVTDADPKVLKNLTVKQRRAMMRQVLADRFHIAAHMETRQLPVYDLVPAKGGIKVKLLAYKADDPACTGAMSASDKEMSGDCIDLPTLTDYLAGLLERTILDKTGLPAGAVFDMKIRFQSTETGPNNGLSDETMPPLFTALQEQLGLKLEPAKGPVETLVVDRIEKPAAN